MQVRIYGTLIDTASFPWQFHSGSAKFTAISDACLLVSGTAGVSRLIQHVSIVGEGGVEPEAGYIYTGPALVLGLVSSSTYLVTSPPP
jgi:hypothetical protein